MQAAIEVEASRGAWQAGAEPGAISHHCYRLRAVKAIRNNAILDLIHYYTLHSLSATSSCFSWTAYIYHIEALRLRLFSQEIRPLHTTRRCLFFGSHSSPIHYTPRQYGQVQFQEG